MGGIIEEQRFAGGPNPEGEGWIPNITQLRLKDWSVEDIADLLEFGQTLGGDSVGGRMAAVVRNTSQLSPEDRTAIATFIKSLAPVEGPPRPAKQ
jgi:mono/diheme cytochrome c family protein